MVKIIDLARGNRDLEVEYGDHKIHLSYNPNLYSPELELEEKEYLDNNQLFLAYAQTLSELLVSWDLEDENGPLGTSFKDVCKVPNAVIFKIRVAIIEDYLPNMMTELSLSSG